MVFHCFDEQNYDNVGCVDILLILLRHINASFGFLIPGCVLVNARVAAVFLFFFRLKLDDSLKIELRLVPLFPLKIALCSNFRNVLPYLFPV